MQHHFDIDVAKEYGVIEAVIINNLQGWIWKNALNESNLHDGRHWTRNSQKAMQDMFPYVTPKQLRDAIDNLVNNGVLIKGNYSQNKFERVLWYAFADEGKWILPAGQFDLPQRAIPFAPEGKTACACANTQNNIYSNNNIQENNIPEYNIVNKEEEQYKLLRQQRIIEGRGDIDTTASAHTHTREESHADTTPSPLFSFDDWWNLYGMVGFRSEYDECLRMWVAFDDIQRKIVMEHTRLFAPANLNLPPDRRKHPKWYLIDKKYLDDVSTIGGTVGQPQFLNGLECDEYWKQGITLVQVKNNEGLYKVCTREEAAKFGLRIEKELRP